MGSLPANAALQTAGVPAGVCQNAQDKYEHDPQLQHLKWTVELPHSAVGTWPVKGVPFRLSRTPPFVGGIVGRSGPMYGEDTDGILRRLLNLSVDEVRGLREAGVV